MQGMSKTAVSVSPVMAFDEGGSLKFGLVLLQHTVKVVGMTAVGTNLAICGAFILSCFSGRNFAMASFPEVRACFIFVVNFVVLEILLFATAILTVGDILAP